MTSDGKGVNERKLKVLYKSTTLRIIFKEKKAIGIEFLKKGEKFRAFARKEVIISAGLYSATDMPNFTDSSSNCQIA